MNTIKKYDPTNWSIRVPKFRTADRAIKWMNRYGFHRLHPVTERVFLNNINFCVYYAIKCKTRLPKDYEDAIINHSSNMALEYLEDAVGGPLVEYEEVIKNYGPETLYEYSKKIIKGRLPEHLELCMIGDPVVLCKYAIEVLDGKLPEVLHNYMFGASLENKENDYYCGQDKLEGIAEFETDEVGAKIYFDFIKYQSKKLRRMLQHHMNMFEINKDNTLEEFINKLNDI